MDGANLTGCLQQQARAEFEKGQKFEEYLKSGPPLPLNPLRVPRNAGAKSVGCKE